MLEALGVSIRRGRRLALDGVSLAPGETVALCGPNGAGKSTLIAALAGDLAPEAGTVLLAGRPIRSLGARALARRRAVLEQAPEIAAPFTVAELVALGAEVAPRRVADLGRLVAQAIADAGVAALADRRADRLSGGGSRCCSTSPPRASTSPTRSR